MKLVIETGSESHTTSSASAQARYHGGPNDGKYLYQVSGRQVKATWLESDKHSRWVQSEYDLPEGTEIAVIGKGATGARGATRSAFHRIYRLDSQAEVLEVQIDVGLRICLLKGRLALVQDVLATQEANAKIDTSDEGF
jgi:hypothetical protein